ncbi:aldose 1-epimerase family protein [Algoriphagus aestuariicola]|uniref:Aldose 1-epimerase family protein n=1 Tax=Algoriphagus aestuariicola TaxID=1852016 RepID=A0ABS3BR86_9BACT|nr:aldose 1-epimerase family protein [Algoriphagus aestuariicola]MBN7800204.1 aldose 1-epimerase family protein [Algoriphagus aestuariicola]
MHYTIESTSLRVQVNLKGMELSSIQSKASGQEYLWQGDPQFWTGQAPVLFPIIGALKDGKTSYEGKDYALPKHGFVRNSDLPKLARQEENLLVFQIDSSAETLEVYPFDFSFEVTFLLEGNRLEVSHQVFNSGDKDLYYSLGGHPAFNCPLLPGEKWEDYQIEFTEKETDHTWMISPQGLIGEMGERLLDNTRTIRLHAHIFDQDALIFKKLKSREVSLSHRDKGPILKMEFGDFDYLGIWAKPGAPFVCLEPWLGIADSVDHSGILAEKEGIRVLEPGKSEVKKYSIEIL